MKTVKLSLKIVATIGLFATIALVDGLYPSTKELCYAALILAMSITMLLAAKRINEILPNDKK